ncbi:hypothetical protein [Paraburkholderia hayleyella]|uniref:hypothetical protein n=1 Tax=Paraburkholderia hayleyella TaxID=2152889 RepID=UPI001291B353|nr:hypothetical protein [Paraburkholderia hayleyella]
MSHIPPYGVILFGVLLYLGIKRCYARSVRPAQLFVLPLAMAVSGALSLPHLFPAAGWQSGLVLLLALLAGLLAGWAHAARWTLAMDVTRSRVRIPGDPALLGMILLTFALGYVIHYQVEAHGAWAASSLFAPFSLAAWGVLGGMALGRALNVLMRYCKTDAAFPGS